MIYGDADDLDVRYEPDTAKRFASVFLLNPATTYHWKFTWGSSIRLMMTRRRLGGNTLYDYGMPTPRGTYRRTPHYAYLGAPVGRSGNESASIAGDDLPQRVARQPRRARRRSAARCCRSSRTPAAAFARAAGAVSATPARPR